jgi:reactive intermediate/imine deaminase
MPATSPASAPMRAGMLEFCFLPLSESQTMIKQAITSPDAPAALGPYSQAICVGHTVYLSGQLGLDPATGKLADGIEAQTHQVFRNLRAVAAAAGGSLNDMVKLTLLLQDLGDFANVNEIMTGYFEQPYPARATYQVAALPKAARIEIDGVLVLEGAPSDPQTGWRQAFDQTKGS